MRSRSLVVVLALLTAVVAWPSSATVGLAAPARSDAAGRAAVAALERATAVNDVDANKLFDDLDEAFARAGAGARVPVIVSFVEGTDTAAGLRNVHRVAPALRASRSFQVVPAFAADITLAEARAIAALPSVRQLETDTVGDPELETATEVMGADAVVDGLDIDGSLDGMSAQITASDVTIAVLDTGFDSGHVDIDGKLETFVDIADARPDPYDSDGHGTHVTSIAAGWGLGDERHRGVAPGAGIVGLRIENESHALAGFEWIVQNRDHYDIRVATISFGFGVATDGTTALERAVDAAWDAGVVCFKSNGNSGPGSSTMTVPAAARGIIAMGSLLDPAGAGTKYGFVLSEYSSRGPTSDGRVKPDLVAPGESILAADAGTGAGYVSLSGTSMAAPFGAGSAALIIAANPALRPDDVRSIMTATAEDFGAPGPDSDYGAGRLQVLDAVEAALGGGPTTVERPAVPSHKAATLIANGATDFSFDVLDTSVPVAVTAIGFPRVLTSPVRNADGLVTHVLVRGPDGVPVTQVPANADRQHHVTFRPNATGRYTVTVMSPTAVQVDVSYGG